MAESSFIAAVSPSASLVAILAANGSAAGNGSGQNQYLESSQGTTHTIRVLLYQNGSLQTTLTHRFSETTSGDKRRGGVLLDDSIFDNVPPRLVFCSSSHLALLLQSRNMIFVWDLTRGVVSQTITPKKEHYFLDITADSPAAGTAGSTASSSSSSDLFALVGKQDSNKVQFHQYQASTGSLKSKVKAGKLSAGSDGDDAADDNDTDAAAMKRHIQSRPRLAVTQRSNSSKNNKEKDFIFVVRSDAGWRAVDAEGEKLSASKSSSSKKESTGAAAAALYDKSVVIHGLTIATTDPTGGGKVVILDAQKGKSKVTLKDSIHLISSASGGADGDAAASLSSSSSSHRLQFVFAAAAAGDGDDDANNSTKHLYLCIDERQLYSIHTGKRVASIQLSPNVDRAAVLLTTTTTNTGLLTGVLYKNGEYQIVQQTVAELLQQNEMTLEWKDDSGADSSTDVLLKKRSREAILGPGQAGGKASQVSELQESSNIAKKVKTGDTAAETTTTNEHDEYDENDAYRDEEEDGNAKSETLAERMRRLRETMDDDDDDDDDIDDEDEDIDDDADDDAKMKKLTKKGKESDNNDGTSTKREFNGKTATTDSLSLFLDQAIRASDDQLIEQALLEVDDEDLIRSTVAQLKDGVPLKLFTELNTRLAAAPKRAHELYPWIAALLECCGGGSGSSQHKNKSNDAAADNEEEDKGIRSVKHLQVLQNLLQERTAVFEDLLKLEGRLRFISSR